MNGWVKGILAAVVGGLATAAGAYLATALGSPDGFVFTAETTKALVNAGLVGGVVALLGYLAKSPIPVGVPEATKDLAAAKAAEIEKKAGE